ncbi:putative transcriptional regulatory protein [Colletotrichum aenigma]|uniref:putative transcriptional regulatory protein n=1 Tax=Colletotrichum aenigma TaxID=1215731 RepID=UPI0018722F36|nr:putative transcriptional regulatory protein [Colletotrichum aenigma]KAF5507236.1 putative transcriptional regulatory protein [Colletotrichum aenigma]
MDPGQPDNKRPRLSTANHPWSPTGAPHNHLPPLHPPSLPPTPHQTHPPHHSAPPPPVPPYHQQQQPPPYPPRSAEPHHPPHPAQQHPDERRHHEQEPPYTPMQEHYRHPASPSPAHPSYNPFPPRDPGGVKREPHDENLSHPRRPHSTGGAPSEGLPPPGPHPPPHSAPPPVPPYNDDPRRPPHMSYDNAPPQMQPPTPGSYRSSYPPPIPPQPPQHYEQPQYPPQQPAPESLYISSYASTQKRKATRASQACDSCRQLKAKCDETKPCKSCREKGVECKYRDPVPKAIDKSQTDILEAIVDMKGSLEKKIETLFDSFEQRIARLEHAPQYKQVKLEADASATTPSPPRKHLSPRSHQQSGQELNHDEAMPMAVGDTDIAYHEQEDRMEADEPEDELPPGPAVAPEAPSIPMNHTTTKGHLLQWPMIKEMTRKALKENGVKFIEEYPWVREEKRGLLRLFGRGEGNGNIFGSSSANPRSEHDAYTDTADDYLGEAVAAPSPGEAWGQVGSLSPPNLTYTSSTLTPEGHPDYTEAKVWGYVKSFEEKILSMHPVIMPSDLRPIVRRFLENVAQGEKRGKPPHPGTAKFAVTHEPTNKRKRSPSGEEPEPVQQPRKLGRPHRTIDAAMVLVVLALGKVAQWTDKIPDPIPDPASNSHNSPMNRNGHPSSPGPGGHGSPPAHSIHSQSSGLPSPKEQNNGLPSRRPSVQGNGAKPMNQSFKRNYDVIPGLEYFAVASDILGQHRSGYTLKHCQTFLLAGLYYGQLGRTLESYRFYIDADVALHTIMRRDQERLRLAAENPLGHPPLTRRENMIVINFWTCLQLQSDIIAEMPVYPSNLTRFEYAVPWPLMHQFSDIEFPEAVLSNYMAQLYLRKRLNALHKLLFEGIDTAMDKMHSALEILSELRAMGWIQEGLRFTEDQPPAGTLMEARLHAKYWGAQVVIFQPFIKLVLDLSWKMQQRTDGATPNSDTTSGLGVFTQGDAAAYIGQGGIDNYKDVNDDVINFAEQGINALIKSTEAFHNVDHDRLHVTNIFGTAHAQWGNLLVLAAAYRDPILGKYINRGHLQALFKRTTKMLGMHAHVNSTLLTDKNILESIERDLFRHDVEDPRMTTSFSSAASMTGPSVPPPTSHPETNHQGPMSMAYAVGPSRSVHNSPNQAYRVLDSRASNHGYQPQSAPM